MVLMARDVAKKVEDEMEYPGQIKVNLVRETRVLITLNNVVLGTGLPATY